MMILIQLNVLRKVAFYFTILFFLLTSVRSNIYAQSKTYQIKADTLRLFSNCDTAELVLQNRTRSITDGVLVNKGNGVTEFRKLLNKVSDSLYMLGADSLKLNFTFGNNLLTSNNGITKSLNNFQLGGALVKPTVFNISNSNYWGFNTPSGDTLSYGSLGYGNTPSFYSTSSISYLTKTNYHIFSNRNAPGINTFPVIQLSSQPDNGYNPDAKFSGILMGFNYGGECAIPTPAAKKNKPLLIMTTGFNNECGGAGDIVLKPGTDIYDFTTRFGNYSVRLEPSGTGTVKIAPPPAANPGNEFLVYNAADSSIRITSTPGTASSYPTGNTGPLVNEYFTDCLSAMPWASFWHDNNSSGSISSVDDGSFSGGAKIGTGTVATGRRGAHTTGTNFRASTGRTIKMKGRIRFDHTASDGTNSSELMFGLYNNLASAATAGAWFQETITTGSVTFQTVTCNNGTRTTTNLTIPTAGAWVVYEVVINGSTNASFYVNGTLVATHTAALPVSNYFGSGVGVRKTAGTVEHSLAVDWLALNQTLTSR